MAIPKHAPASVAFSLVEVVMALGITSFALMAMLGLFTTGVKTSSESEKQIQAANLASMLISVRQNSSTNAISNFAIPPLNVPYRKAYSSGNTLTNYVDATGTLTTAANAAYTISCMVGTNSPYGSKIAQVYLMLTWPARADPAGQQVGRYELTTFIPLP